MPTITLGKTRDASLMTIGKAPSNAVVQLRDGTYKNQNLIILPSVGDTSNIHAQSLTCGTVIVCASQEQCRVVGTYEINVVLQKDFS